MPATTTLTPVQEAVINHLSTGATLSLAAESANIHRNTIANWRRTSPAFTAALAHAQYDRLLHFRDLAESHCELAISTIRNLLADPKTPAGIRLKAALAILKECTTPLPAPPAVATPSSAEVPTETNVEDPTDPSDCAAAPECTIMHNSAQSSTATFRRPLPKTGRNEACPCGSGQKYKRCCLTKTESTAQAIAA